MTARTASISRSTSESSIELSLDLDGTGSSDVSTSVPFFDHMLTAFSKHSLIDLRRALDGRHRHRRAPHRRGHRHRARSGAEAGLGDRAGIGRYGDALVPLDEALAQAVVDVSGRPYLVHSGEPEGFAFHRIGGHFTGSMVRHVFEAITFNAGITVHVRVLGAVTRTTSPRPSSRPSPVRCAAPSSSTPGSTASRPRRGSCDREAERRRPRLRIGQRPLRGEGTRARRCRGHADRRQAGRAPCGRSARAGRRRLRRRRRPARGCARAARSSPPPGRRSTGARICVGMQVMFAGASSAAPTSRGSASGRARRGDPGRGPAAHGLEHGRGARGLRALRRAATTSGSTSSTRTA